jgi:hypothetical protein
VIVVDTSVLVDFLRGRRTPATALLERLERDETPYAIPGICCQEILQGARDEREWNRLREYLVTQLVAQPENPLRTHVEAARIYFDLRRRGVTVRSTVDCWIAQIVLEQDGFLLHDDADFDAIAEHRPLRTLPE